MKIYDVRGIGANLTGSFSGSFDGLFAGTVEGVSATASYVEYTNVANKPTLVSGSAQISEFGIFATTGSNQFNGNQSITGSLTVSGQVVAQTLNVQQVTSSVVYSSGSNVFGNDLSNTQQFTGSVGVTGSLTVAGAGTFIGSVTSVGGLINGSDFRYTPSGNTEGLPVLVLKNPSSGVLSLASEIIGNAFVNSNSLALSVSNTTSGRFNALTIASTGNLLVGTTADNGARLQVKMANDGLLSFLETGTSSVAVKSSGSLVMEANPSSNFIFRGFDVGAGVTERMRITSTGNVGIGTAAPSSMLQVNGEVKFGIEASPIRINSSSSTGIIEFPNTTVNSIIRTLGETPLVFQINSTEWMRITSDGKVGIGTASPQQAIHTQSAGSSTIIAERTGANAGIIGLYASQNPALVWGTSTDFLRFAVIDDTSLGGFAERMRISTSGNLLVGTTTDNGARLQVSGTATFSSSVTAGDGTQTPASDATITIRKGVAFAGLDFKSARTSGNIGGLRFYNSDDTIKTQILAEVDSSLVFYTNTSSQRMRITSDGNVGIGTSSPSTKLDVRSLGAGENLNLLYLSADAAATGGATAALNVSAASNLIKFTTQTNDSISFETNGTNERMRITSTGNVGIGTASPSVLLNTFKNDDLFTIQLRAESNTSSVLSYTGIAPAVIEYYRNTATGVDLTIQTKIALGGAGGNIVFAPQGTATSLTPVERMRITKEGNVLIQKEVANNTDTGVAWNFNDYLGIAHNSSDSGDRVILINRNASDGSLIDFRQGNVTEGSINVSGTTVSYNGGHLSRWSQTESNEIIEGLVKGTVMSNLDQMAVWVNPETGEPYPNEQLNCMKISDIEGDPNVAGVFVNWQYDSELLTNDMNIAMTGDMIIRIAPGITVQRGDLLISAGDGTAKPQDDDIIRNSTIAKVTSTHITCTYEDGSYCVPCVLMAC